MNAAHSASHLHVVDDLEAEVRTLRAAAYLGFQRRYRHNLSSQQTMVEALESFARHSSRGLHHARDYPWELLTDEQTVDDLWRDAIGDRSRNTALKWATAIRVMLACCRRVGLLDPEEFTRATEFETKNAGKVLKPAGRYLTEDQVNQLLDSIRNDTACHPTTRVRDLALIAILASSGIRSVEVTGLQVDDIVPNENRMNLSITKGGRPRKAWLHAVAVTAAEDWLTARGRTPGPLFVPLSRTGRPMLEHGPLSYHQVWKILRHRAEDAGLGVVTPHDLRRFVITTLLDKGYDLMLVCRIAGHVRPETTGLYDRRPAAAQRAAIESLELRNFTTWKRRRSGHS